MTKETVPSDGSLSALNETATRLAFGAACRLVANPDPVRITAGFLKTKTELEAMILKAESFGSAEFVRLAASYLRELSAEPHVRVEELEQRVLSKILASLKLEKLFRKGVQISADNQIIEFPNDLQKIDERAPIEKFCAPFNYNDVMSDLEQLEHCFGAGENPKRLESGELLRILKSLLEIAKTQKRDDAELGAEMPALALTVLGTGLADLHEFVKHHPLVGERAIDSRNPQLVELPQFCEQVLKKLNHTADQQTFKLIVTQIYTALLQIGDIYARGFRQQDKGQQKNTCEIFQTLVELVHVDRIFSNDERIGALVNSIALKIEIAEYLTETELAQVVTELKQVAKLFLQDFHEENKCTAPQGRQLTTLLEQIKLDVLEGWYEKSVRHDAGGNRHYSEKVSRLLNFLAMTATFLAKIELSPEQQKRAGINSCTITQIIDALIEKMGMLYDSERALVARRPERISIRNDIGTSFCNLCLGAMRQHAHSDAEMLNLLTKNIAVVSAQCDLVGSQFLLEATRIMRTVTATESRHAETLRDELFGLWHTLEKDNHTLSQIATDTLRSQLDTKAKEQLLQLIIEIIDIHERGTSNHSKLVSALAENFGGRFENSELKQLGVKTTVKNLQEKLRVGGLLHDFGKVGISTSILLKPERLSAEEFQTMQTHTTVGAELLRDTEFGFVTDIARHHHERFDGAGYPAELVGDRIPFAARATAVFDTFSASMENHRKYKSLDFSSPRETFVFGLAEVIGDSGTRLDPALVDIFLEQYGINSRAVHAFLKKEYRDQKMQKEALREYLEHTINFNNANVVADSQEITRQLKLEKSGKREQDAKVAETIALLAQLGYDKATLANLKRIGLTSADLALISAKYEDREALLYALTPDSSALERDTRGQILKAV